MVRLKLANAVAVKLINQGALDENSVVTLADLARRILRAEGREFEQCAERDARTMPDARGGGSRIASPPASGAMISSAGAAGGHRRGLHLARRLVHHGDRGRRRLLLLNMRSTQH